MGGIVSGAVRVGSVGGVGGICGCRFREGGGGSGSVGASAVVVGWSASSNLGFGAAIVCVIGVHLTRGDGIANVAESVVVHLLLLMGRGVLDIVAAFVVLLLFIFGGLAVGTVITRDNAAGALAAVAIATPAPGANAADARRRAWPRLFWRLRRRRMRLRCCRWSVSTVFGPASRRSRAAEDTCAARAHAVGASCVFAVCAMRRRVGQV